MRRFFVALGFAVLLVAPIEAQDFTTPIVPETFESVVPPPCCDDLADPPPPVPPYDYVFTPAERLSAAHACVHEATWAGGRRTVDCGGMIQVVMERRRLVWARGGRRMQTFAESLADTMRRFNAGTTSRSWVRRLPAGHIPLDFEWPWAVPAIHYDPHWQAVRTRVNRYADGVEPLPCWPPPSQWFGREVDSEAIARNLANGWAISDCGEPTEGEEYASVNEYLYPLPEPEE